jgi:hypothetical protein
MISLAESSPVIAAILGTLVRMDNRIPWFTAPYGHQDGVQGEFSA